MDIAKIEESWHKAISNVAFANDVHQDIAYTWYGQGFIDRDKLAPSKEDIEKMVRLSLQWSDECLRHTDILLKYPGESGRIKYIQDYWDTYGKN